MSLWRSSLATLVLLVLAACGEVPRVFEDENKAVAPSPLLVPRADASLVVVPVRNAPREVSVEFAELVADRFRALDVPASTRTASVTSRILEGEATTTPLPGGIANLDITWRVIEPNGLPILTARQIERVPEVLWRRADRALLTKLAGDIARRIEKDIRVDSGTAPMAALRVRSPVVAGAPGDGNEALARAIRLLLARQEVALVEQDDRDAISLQGRVLVRPDGAQDRVDIEWVVRGTDGRALGTVAQSNVVPRGSLSGRWGQVAYAAAEGGVEGILQLLQSSNARR